MFNDFGLKSNPSAETLNIPLYPANAIPKRTHSVTNYFPEFSRNITSTPVSPSYSRLRQKSFSLDPYIQADDSAFTEIFDDEQYRFNPVELNFVPRKYFQDRTYSFGEIISGFFQKKNSSNSRFSHKLFNSIKLGEYDEKFVQFVGVKWLNRAVLRVEKRVFARLIGVKSVDGSLFHQQGNFTSHGFIEISEGEVPSLCPDIDLTGVDFDNVRLLYHHDGLFHAASTGEEVEAIRWINRKKLE